MVRFAGGRKGNPQLFAINDSGTGMIAAFGMMLGLYHKLRTGVGQFMGASLSQTCALWQMPYMIAHENRDWNDPGGLDFRGYGPLDRVYQSGDGRWLYLAADGADGLADLASVAGLEGIDKVASSKLQEELTKRFAQEPVQTWLDRLSGLKHVGASLCARLEEAMKDPWAIGHGLVRQVDFPKAGVGTIVGPAPVLSLTPMRLGAPVGPPGYDTEKILRKVGLADRTQELVAAGAVALMQGEFPEH
jgi:crotonobetainyl-CoA:carnitine CoA-transferase CaiB-like acyl-CoA transferase